jgi:hypothetical protein
VRAGGKFPEDDEAAGGFVFMEHLEFNAGIRAGLPGLLGGVCEVLEHGPMATAGRRFGKPGFSRARP